MARARGTVARAVAGALLAFLLAGAKPAAAAECVRRIGRRSDRGTQGDRAQRRSSGASPELQRVARRSALLERVVPVCLDRRAERNTTERGENGLPITITWNPELRTELEQGCGGDAAAVRRDPIARDARARARRPGRPPEADVTESEAVRIENIYRRANGLCQRTRYGDDPLPAALLVDCSRRAVLPARPRRRSRPVTPPRAAPAPNCRGVGGGR